MSHHHFEKAKLVHALKALRSCSGHDILPTMRLNTARRIFAEPLAYLQFGAWWWSVKRVLQDGGYIFGPTDIPALREAYGFEGEPELTLLAGWTFADENGARVALEIPADYAGQGYSLVDPDMEPGAALETAPA